MSDSTPTAPLRRLKSPFNGEVITVSPDVNDRMYQAMLQAGFIEVPPLKRKEEPRGRS